MDFWGSAQVRSFNCNMYWPLFNMYWKSSGFGLYIRGSLLIGGRDYIHIAPKYIYIYIYIEVLLTYLEPHGVLGCS